MEKDVFRKGRNDDEVPIVDLFFHCLSYLTSLFVLSALSWSGFLRELVRGLLWESFRMSQGDLPLTDLPSLKVSCLKGACFFFLYVFMLFAFFTRLSSCPRLCCFHDYHGFFHSCNLRTRDRNRPLNFSCSNRRLKLFIHLSLAQFFSYFFYSLP